MGGACALIGGFSTACADDSSDDGYTRYVEQQHLFPTGNRDVDVLFVIENGPRMVDQQAALDASLRQFADELVSVPGEPSIHVGVVSTDLGTGSFSYPGCVDDGAVLQNAPRQLGCAAPSEPYLRDVELPDGTRDRNYTGALADALSCIGLLGADGCRFPQPLEATRRALDGSVAGNDGFLRDDALLVVAIVAPTDDCSARSSQLFDTGQTLVTDPLGPATPFRCFDFGVQCDPDNPRTTGFKSECVPREDSQLVHPVQEYIDFLKQLKAPRSQDVMIAGIMGNTEPLIVGADADGLPQVEPSCQRAAGVATPGIRLSSFTQAFPQRNALTSICNDDWSGASAVVFDLLRAYSPVPCLRGPLVDADGASPGLQPVCSVSEVRDPSGAARSEELLSTCDRPGDPESSSNRPCYLLTQDSTCDTSGVRFDYVAGDALPSPDTVVSVRCLAPEQTLPSPPCGSEAPCPDDWQCVELPAPYRRPQCVRPCSSDGQCELPQMCSGLALGPYGCQGLCTPVRYCESECLLDYECPNGDP